MSALSRYHRELDAGGVGKCSVPIWCNGLPAGFCDRPAYGKPEPCEMVRAGDGGQVRSDGRYSGYVPALACFQHGGPSKPEPAELPPHPYLDPPNTMPPFPAEPASGSPAAVAQAAETLAKEEAEYLRRPEWPDQETELAAAETAGELEGERQRRLHGERADAEALSKPAHTPGPWSRAGNGQAVPYHIYSSADRDANGSGCVATCHWMSAGSAEANARLIARAPELLAENERLQSRVDYLASELVLDTGVSLLRAQRDGLADALEDLVELYVADIVPPHHGPGASKTWAAWDVARAALREIGRLP